MGGWAWGEVREDSRRRGGLENCGWNVKLSLFFFKKSQKEGIDLNHTLPKIN